MGKEIVYCVKCGTSLREEEFESGAARMVEDRPYCAACRPPSPSRDSAKAPPVQTPMPRKSTARIQRLPQTTRRAPPEGPARNRRVLVWVAVAVLGLIFLILLIVALSKG